jgi:hypothetical protein
MKRPNTNLFVVPDKPTQDRAKRNYVPSYQREGFDESKVEVLPSYGVEGRNPGSAFVITRDRPTFS